MKGLALPVVKLIDRYIIKNFFLILAFLAYATPRLQMSVHKCQPIRSSRLAGNREHIYEFLVLLYR